MSCGDVEFVVVAFHRPHELERLLGGLRLTGAVIRVINVEADPSISQLARDGVEVVDVVENCGYASAVNLGVAMASANVVVFCNDDVEIDAHSVQLLLEPIDDGAADVTVPAHLSGSGERLPSLLPLARPGTLVREWLLEPLFSRGTTLIRTRRPPADETIEAANAALVACRRVALQQVPLSEAYFLYWEEVEWFSRLGRAGFTTRYVHGATLVRRGGAEELSSGKSTLMAVNAVRCVRDTSGTAAGLAAWPIVVLWNLRLVLAAVGRWLGPGSRPEWTHALRSRISGLWASVGAWRVLVVRSRTPPR